MNVIEVDKINDNLYILNENINPEVYITMALVIGSEKAAIIDTGYGISGDLDKVIRNITDKPLICLLTHCDPDHAGSAALFDEIHMSNLEEEAMRKGTIKPQTRLMIAKNSSDGNKELVEYSKEHIVKNSSFQYKNIEDGDIFDLGGCELDTPYMPPFLKIDLHNANWIAKIIMSVIMKFLIKKQLGNSLPLEHKKAGYTASLKYNANKI